MTKPITYEKMEKARFGGSTCSACGGEIAKGSYYVGDRHACCPEAAPLGVASPAPAPVAAAPRPRLYRCRCGATGYAGRYPFSTIAGGSVCDDCLA